MQKKQQKNPESGIWDCEEGIIVIELSQIQKDRQFWLFGMGKSQRYQAAVDGQNAASIIGKR